MGKNNRPAPVAPQAPAVKIRVTPLYAKSLKAYKHDKRIASAIAAFVAHKRVDPNSPFGGSDKPFVGGALKGLLHAHLTHDDSIVYSISGRNPQIIVIYGVWSHDDLGTGQPPNQRKQAAAAASISNQDSFIPVTALDEQVS